MDNSTDNTYDRWSEEFSNPEDLFLIYFCNELLSDVTLIVGADKKRIPGHKIILSRSSYEFYNVFNNIKLDKDELLIEDVTEEAFLCFLKFCYTGRVELDGIDIFALFKFAYRFQVKHLIEKIDTHLLELVEKENCLEIYIKSPLLNQDSKLKEKILSEVQLHFVWLTSQENQEQIFNNLPLEALKEIVDLENLRCDEMLLFDGIINWAKFNCERKNISPKPQNLRRILGVVFYKIRFPTMKSDWFDEILLEYPNLFTGKEISDILRDIKSDEKSCLRFSFKLRSRGYAYVRDPLTINSEITGKIIQCFQVSFKLKLRNESSSSMSICIRLIRNYAKDVLGFAFIGKRNQNKKIITCQVKEDGVWPADKLELETEIKENWILSWDYDLTIVVFKQKLNLETEKWYNLYCKSNCDMVKVECIPLERDRGLNFNGVYVKESSLNTIPYLICDK